MTLCGLSRLCRRELTLLFCQASLCLTLCIQFLCSRSGVRVGHWAETLLIDNLSIDFAFPNLRHGALRCNAGHDDRQEQKSVAQMDSAHMLKCKA